MVHIPSRLFYVSAIGWSNDELEADWCLYWNIAMILYLILSFFVPFLCHFCNQNRLQNLKLFRLEDFLRKFIRQLYEQLSRWCFRLTGDAQRIDQEIRISTWIIITIFDPKVRSDCDHILKLHNSGKREILVKNRDKIEY